MTEHRYQIQVSTQLGMRRGTLTWTEQGSALQGDAALSAPGKSVFRAGLLCRSARLFRADPDPCLPHPLSGRLRSGRQRPDGHFPHGIRRLYHRRGSVRTGKSPQRRNDLSPLSALLWQNHRCFTPPKSRKSFFLAAKSPSASCYGNRGALFALFVLFIGASQALTQSLAGVLDCSLSGCQNYRAFARTHIWYSATISGIVTIHSRVVTTLIALA